MYIFIIITKSYITSELINTQFAINKVVIGSINTSGTTMKKINKSIFLALAITSVTPLLAQAEGFYGAAQLGYSTQANDSKAIGNNIAVDEDFPSEFDAGNGSVAIIGLGYKFNQQFRLEARIGYHDSDFNESKIGSGARDGEQYSLNGDLQSTTYTIEGFYDFTNTTAFTPYIKLGLGLADNSYSAKLGGAGIAGFDAFDGAVDGYYDNYADDNSTDFTWNVGAGVNYEINKTVSVYTEYQYIEFGDVKTGQDDFTDGFKIDSAASHEFMLGVKVKL